MKVRLGPTNELPTIRGRVLAIVGPHGITLQKWPRKRPDKPTPYEFYRRGEFAHAGRFSASPFTLDLETATHFVKGTSMVPRDFLMRCAMGVGYVVVMPDGSLMEGWRVNNPNPQLILDLIDDTPGILIMRTNEGWVRIAPGLSGQVLTYIDPDNVRWQTPNAASGGTSQTANAVFSASPLSTTAFAFKGLILRPGRLVAIQALTAIGLLPTAAWYQAKVLELNGLSTTPTVTAAWDGEPIENLYGADINQLLLPMVTPIVLDPTKYYALMVGRTDGASNYVLPLIGPSSAQSTAFPFPIDGRWWGNCRIASVNPGVGDVLAATTASIPVYGISIHYTYP